jgi:hypothetical protein
MSELVVPTVAVAGGVLLVLLYRINQRLYDDHFSPLGLLIYSWFVPLWFRSFNLSSLETDWTWKSHFGVWSVSGILLICSLLPVLRGVEKNDFRTRGETFRNSLDVISSTGAKLLAVSSFCVLFSIYLWTEFVTNPAGVALFSAISGRLDQDLAAFYNWGKTIGRTPLTSILLILTGFLYPLSGILYFQSTRTRGLGRRYFFVCLALLTPMFSLMKLSKTDVLVSSLALGIAVYYCHRYRPDRPIKTPAIRKRLLSAIALILVIVVPFWLTSTLRIGDQGTTRAGAIIIDWIQFRFDEHTPLNTFLATVYTYTALCFENFHRYANVYDGTTNLGISALRPLLSVLMLGETADLKLSLIDFNYVFDGAAIAPTFMTPVLAEGGWVFLLATAACYGLLINTLYARFRLTPSYVGVLLYGNFAFCWIFMFFSNAFGTLLFYTTAGLLMMFSNLLGTSSEMNLITMRQGVAAANRNSTSSSLHGRDADRRPSATTRPLASR